MLLITLLLVVAGVTVVPAGPVAAERTSSTSAAGVRRCGTVRSSLAIRVTASRVRCGQARRLMKTLLAGSRQCYPHGYTATPRCVVEGFRCSAQIRRGTSYGVCVKGRQVARGTAR